MLRLLMFLLFCSVSGLSHAEDQGLDEFTRAVYASAADSIHREYDQMLARTPPGIAPDKAEASRRSIKMFFYNKAALFASCAEEAEKERDPNTPPVAAEKNPVLTACVDKAIAEFNALPNRLSYARVFFPQRVPKCAQEARLPSREKLLPPYEFLHLDEPRLYDFARYNQCLMTPE